MGRLLVAAGVGAAYLLLREAGVPQQAGAPVADAPPALVLVRGEGPAAPGARRGASEVVRIGVRVHVVSLSLQR
jgi:hypothetical protein